MKPIESASISTSNPPSPEVIRKQIRKHALTLTMHICPNQARIPTNSSYIYGTNLSEVESIFNIAHVLQSTLRTEREAGGERKRHVYRRVDMEARGLRRGYHSGQLRGRLGYCLFIERNFDLVRSTQDRSAPRGGLSRSITNFTIASFAPSGGASSLAANGRRSARASRLLAARVVQT